MDPQLRKDSILTSYTYGVGANFLPMPPTRAHHEFKGWFTDPAYTGTPVTSIAYDATGAKVFYANWERTSNEATLSYDANGGANPPAAQAVTIPVTGSVTTKLAGAGTMAHPSIGGSDVLILGWTPAVVEAATQDQTYTATWRQDNQGEAPAVVLPPLTTPCAMNPTASRSIKMSVTPEIPWRS